MDPPKNERGPWTIVLTLSGTVAGLIVTLLWMQLDSIKNDLRIHDMLPHHAEMGEQMAGVRQRLGEQDLKTADRFTRTDWNAAVRWITSLFDNVDHRLEALEERADEKRRESHSGAR